MRLLAAAGLVGLAVGCQAGDEAPEARQPAAAVTEEATDPALGSETLPPAEEDLAPDAGSGDEQVARLVQAVADAPDDVLLRRRLAIALHKVGRRDEAVEQFEQVVERQPDRRHLLDLALAYGSASRLADAERTYRRLLELSPDDAIVLHNMGNLATKRGDTETAIELYTASVRSKPEYILALHHLADALRTAGRYKEAYGTYEKVLALEPTTIPELKAFDDSMYRMASLDLMMGAHERAAQLLEVLLSSNPDHASAHYAYGQVLLQLGRPDEAQREFETHMALLAEQQPAGPVATQE